MVSTRVTPDSIVYRCLAFFSPIILTSSHLERHFGALAGYVFSQGTYVFH